MTSRRGTDAGYSTGCAVVWAAILSALAALGETEKLLSALPAFPGGECCRFPLPWGDGVATLSRFRTEA
jgi:hypothetical protein